MTEKFLLDSNILIEPHRLYYPFDFAKGFWDQMEQKITDESVYVLDVVEAEIKRNEDELAKWLKEIDHFKSVSVKQIEIIDNYRKVLDYIQNSGYYHEQALRKWAQGEVADSWLIAAAITMDATIITMEKASSNLSTKNKSKNAKIPNVAEAFDIQCYDLFYFMRQTGFRL